ncbi:hypothetical protein [Microbacterium sp. USHLN272]|uniref:hypothetical protein n=1 Tax=Microbacterium sp. USHLN272 TaxID=3081287 RepID=UPI0030197E2A
MPKIPYDALKFPVSLPVWSRTTTGRTPGSHSGEANAPLAELMAHAASVGDTSIVTGTATRRALDMRWRLAAIEAALEDVGGYWAPSEAYLEHLDSSEKTFVSYLLGMTQASLMSEHILGTVALVHVDAVLRLFGHLHRAKRPDLIGYSASAAAFGRRGGTPLGRVLVEAKGTSGPKDQQAIDDALAQLKPGVGTLPNPNLRQLAFLLGRHSLRVVSHAYFDPAFPGSASPVWSSHLEDPPGDGDVPSEWDDDEFRGLLLLAKLLPVADAMRLNPEIDFEWPEAVGAETSAVQVAPGVVFGLPAHLGEMLQGIVGLHPLGFSRSEQDQVEVRRLARLANDLRPPEIMLPRNASRFQDWEIGKLLSGFCVARFVGDGD